MDTYDCWLQQNMEQHGEEKEEYDDDGNNNDDLDIELVDYECSLVSLPSK